MKHIMKKSIMLLLCVCMIVPVLASFSALAEEITFEDQWKDTLYPAYMSTSNKSIGDRLEGDGTTIKPMTLFCVVKGIAFYVDDITGELVALTLKDPSLTKAKILEMNEIPEYTSYYSTNPYNAGSAVSVNEKPSSDAVKEGLYAQLVIDYTMGSSDMKMNSFKDAAANNQINVTNIRNGVRVEYSIGREQVIYLAPRLIKAEKLVGDRETFLKASNGNGEYGGLIGQIQRNSQVERDHRTVLAYYIRYDLEDESLPEITKVDYKKQYPITEQFAIYACDTKITNTELGRLENFFKLYTDYTIEQMNEDHAETDYQSTEANPPLFKMAIEYTANDDHSISIRLNAGNIRFASDLYTLSNVTLLPYGGAGDTHHKGYIFTPDGSGSLISFEDAAMAGNVTKSNSMYGIDYVYHTITGAHDEGMRLPVYGVIETIDTGRTKMVEVEKTDEFGNVLYDDEGNPVIELVPTNEELGIGFLAIIEQGDSLARIKVENGGSQHSFVSVCTTFNPRPQDTYSLSGGISNDSNATWTVSSKRKYTGDYKIRLYMLEPDEGSDVVTVSDMARVYRNYLIGNGTLKPLEKSDKEDIPLYLETLGALEISTEILGLPTIKMIALSSFEDDKTVITELQNAGISNINLRMLGWLNGGMFMTPPAKIKVEKVLGGKEGLESLVSFAGDKNVTLFPDLEFTLLHEIGFADGFSLKHDTAKTIDNRTATFRQYDPTWQGFLSGGSAIISSGKMETFYDKISDTYNGFNIGAISVGSLGQYLNSDFNEDNPLNREDSKILVERLLQKIRTQNEKVLICGGNVYALPYVTDILEMPLENSGYVNACAPVPFMSMVLHGYKEYAGGALNLAGDYSYTLLKSIENGASPYFVVAMNNTAELKDYSYSYLSKYYSVRYAIWKDSIISAYEILNNALKSVKYETIVKHEFVDDNNEKRVVKMTYSNGDVFYINYLTSDYSVPKTTVVVPSYGFVKVSADGSRMIYDGTKVTMQK